MLSGGAYVDRLEKEFAEIHGMDPALAISVTNGTTALFLPLLAIGAGPGDEVIIPGWCFAAAANMVLACGATPVFADVFDDTWLLDPAAVDACVTPRTKAIIAVHTYGGVCDMAALNSIARWREIVLIEDCAESLFSRFQGRHAGTCGDVGAFSFQATKTITCGEGGMVLAREPELASRMRLIRNHGMTANRKYWHHLAGHNFRLTNLQAAVACAQLRHRDEIIERRRNIYEAYCRRLPGTPSLSLQRIPPDVDPLMWAFAFRLDSAVAGITRDQLMAGLANRGIETRPGFHAFSEQPVYQAAPLARSPAIALEVITLPSYAGLAAAQIDFICGSLESCLTSTPIEVHS
jgi:perosamine synthetase